MKINIEINEKIYSCDLSKPIDISIPLDFNGDQPNTYDVEIATSKAFQSGDFIGDTRKGGGCNFEQHRLIPHCNGTHTEGIGHISLERISINEILSDILIPATLISINPEKASDTDETYIPDKKNEDFLITKKVLCESLKNADKSFLDALIIRTLPNEESKKSRRYMNFPPPFFSIESMKYIDSLGVNHLLVDFPSVDRTFDEGKLTAHHIFWNVPFESHDVDKRNHSMKTITEMVYASDKIEDGKYFLNIQIPNFVADAAPSRVLIYQISD